MDEWRLRKFLGRILYVCLLGIILAICVVGIWIVRPKDAKFTHENNVTRDSVNVTTTFQTDIHEEVEVSDVNGTTNNEEQPLYRILLNAKQNSSSGRVYIQTDEHLGFLCSDFFTEADAEVVCNELGYQESVIYNSMGSVPYTRYTNNQPVLKQLNCTGSESTIEECEGFRLRNVTSCTWFAAVICYNDIPYKLRLVNGNSLGSGLVEMEVDGVWGTFCAIRNFDDELADILCRELDYTGGVTLPRGELGDANLSKVWVPYISCPGGSHSKKSILDCAFILHTENILYDLVEFRNNRYRNEYMACTGTPSFAASVQCFKHEFQG